MGMRLLLLLWFVGLAAGFVNLLPGRAAGARSGLVRVRVQGPGAGAAATGFSRPRSTSSVLAGLGTLSSVYASRSAVGDSGLGGSPRGLLAVGTQVVGKVEDSDDQYVTFSVGDRQARLSTLNLSWTERMALQVGGLMQLYVTKDSESGQLGVALHPPSSSSSSSSSSAGGLPKPALKNLSSSPRAKKQQTAAGGSATPSGVLLNNLKTGMKLTGTVSSCTPYAAFVLAGVQRSAKGGQFKVEHGMLHKNDIPRSMLSKGAGHSSPLLAAGTPVTVYVKEVFKNSGRYTLTMDPSFEKSLVLERKQRTKDEGKERRRARRMRRVLDLVTVGDTVTGVVQSIVPEGVLVTISSLGSLNVTGLLLKRDLPKQFSVPPDLKESFQAQLLAQDFAPGRVVSCGVVAVNTNPTAAADEFNLKLLFEDFGAMPTDEVVITDKLETLKGKGAKAKVALPKGMVLDRDEDDEDEDGEEDDEGEDLALAADNDIKEIYDELRGNKPLMLVQDLYDWADIQDMLANGDISDDDLKRALKEVKIPGTKEIKLGQFREVVDILQDALDGVSPDELKAYEAEGDEDDEDDADLSDADIAALPPLPAKLQPMMAAEGAGKAAKAKAKGPAAPAAPAPEVDEEGAPLSLDEGVVDSIEDEALKEVAQEIFDELRGKSKTLSVKAFKGWSDIRDLKENALIDDDSIQEALDEVGAKTSLTFEQFFEAVQILEDYAAEGEEGEGDEEDGDADADADDDEYIEIDEAEEEAMLKEMYEKLQNKSGKVTVAAFKKWDEISSANLPAEEVDGALRAAGVGSKGNLSLEQFIAVVRSLDESEEIEVDEDEDEDGDNEGEGETVDDELEIDFDDENMTPEENSEMLKMLFDTLRGNKDTVSLKTFMAWDDVQDMMSEGVLDQETLDVFLAEVGVKKKATDLTQEQFIALVTMLDENMRAMGDGEGEDGEDGEDEGEDGDDEPEIDSAELEAVAREIYDELRGKNKALPVKSFRRWTEVQEAVKAGIMTENTLDVLVREVASPGATELTFEEFQRLVGLLDQVADAAMGATAEESTNLKGQPSASKGAKSAAADEDNEDDEDGSVFEMDEEEPTPEELEAFAREVFDEIKSPKSNKVTVKALKAWEGIKEVLESGELTAQDLDAVIAEVDEAGTGSLNFAQFRAAMELIEDAMDEADGDYDDDDEEEEEEEVEAAPVSKGKGAAAAAGKGKGAAKTELAQAAASVGGKGFARADEKKPPAAAAAASKTGKKGAAAKASAASDEDEALEVATEIFDELRGRRKTLSVKVFKEWEDTRDLIEAGALKRSTLEKALVKVGAAESGEMSLKQFVALVDIIQASIDESSLSLAGLDDEDDDEPQARIPTSKAGKVLSVGGAGGDGGEEGEEIDWESVDDMEEQSEEEQAQAVFDELRGSKKTLSLVDFLQWEDVQELLECGALSKDNLASAIESAGVTVDTEGLTFQTFFDLIQIIDDFVDQDKLPGEELDEDDEDNDGGDEEDEEDEDEDGVTTGASSSSLSRGKGSIDDFADLSLGDGEDDEDDDEQDDEEVEEMFNDIANGKSSITKSALYSWDELQELMQSGMVDRETIDSYVAQVNFEDGRLDLEAFRAFIRLLDTVLVDGEGNLLD